MRRRTTTTPTTAPPRPLTHPTRRRWWWSWWWRARATLVFVLLLALAVCRLHVVDASSSAGGGGSVGVGGGGVGGNVACPCSPDVPARVCDSCLSGVDAEGACRALASGAAGRLPTCVEWPLDALLGGEAPPVVVAATASSGIAAAAAPAAAATGGGSGGRGGGGGGACEHTLRRVLAQDCCARFLTNSFLQVLARFDPRVKYSQEFKVPQCQDAYRWWACSSQLEVKMNNKTMPPCASFCDRVEERCPYFAPKKPLQYAGEPTFFCHDPTIVEDPAVIVPVTETAHECCYKSEYLSAAPPGGGGGGVEDAASCNHTGLEPWNTTTPILNGTWLPDLLGVT